MKEATTNTGVLCWPKRLLSADDLRRHLNGQRELVLLPKTIVTPLAADELRAKGVRILWEAPKPGAAAATTNRWFYAKEKDQALIASVVQALERDGIALAILDGTPRTLAEKLTGNYVGGIIFTGDTATVVCIANKVAGVRAAAVGSVPQVTRARKALGANLYAIEIPGPTFFEVRQMLRTIVSGVTQCPDDLAKTLKELDGHAHR